jgi:aryl-alcohol dehydrogenase-like predicted oxidoreductase
VLSSPAIVVRWSSRTKGGLRLTDAGRGVDASPEWLRRGVDASLAALGVDYIDLYQVHWPDPKVPAAETAGALAELIAAGKIRHAGVRALPGKRVIASVSPFVAELITLVVVYDPPRRIAIRRRVRPTPAKSRWRR